MAREKLTIKIKSECCQATTMLLLFCAVCCAPSSASYVKIDRCSYILILFRFVCSSFQAQISLLLPKRQRLQESYTIRSPVDHHIGDVDDDSDTEEGELIKTKVRNLMSSLTLFNIILIYCFLLCAQLYSIPPVVTVASFVCTCHRTERAFRSLIQQQQRQQLKTNST